MRAPVEQVIQTGTGVLDGHLDSREAITILATLARDAVSAAHRLQRAEPERAAGYGEILASVEQELRNRAGDSDRPRGLEAVADDLAKVRRALTDPSRPAPGGA